MRHAWKKWKEKTERCIRLGCPVLRRRIKRGKRWDYHTGVRPEWVRDAPPCIGGSTADKA